jgi:hypothetical protein
MFKKMLPMACFMLSMPLGAGLVLEVSNKAHERLQQPVLRELTVAEDAEAKGNVLVELGPGDQIVSRVVFAIDHTGKNPVLSWVMPGITPRGATRRFTFVSEQKVEKLPAAPATDLTCEVQDGKIKIGTLYFSLSHKEKGNGGTPGDIQFKSSGYTDTRLYLYDRLYAEDIGQPQLNQDANATASVIFQSPARVVVESTGTYAMPDGKPAPGNFKVVYRYVYSAYSPTVDVVAAISRDGGNYGLNKVQIHFLHLTRDDKYYTSFVTGDPIRTFPMQEKGVKSMSREGGNYGVMSTANEAAGVGGKNVSCWDASSTFCYYACPERTFLEKGERYKKLSGTLYFGPHSSDPDWYSRWLGAERNPGVTVKIVKTQKTLALKNCLELTTKNMRVVFAGPEQGFAVLGIENLLAGNVRFCNTDEGAIGLWELQFMEPMKKGDKPLLNYLDSSRSFIINPNGKKCRYQQISGEMGYRFLWENLDLPGEPGAVDVICEVRAVPGKEYTEWYITVKNRSKKYGLWEYTYPMLKQVFVPGTGDAMIPSGTWGGRFYKNSKATCGNFIYPSGGINVQFMGLNLGEAGFYYAAHDAKANTKLLQLSPEQNVGVLTLAENMGQPGAGCDKEFPVVVGAYKGDWWKAAKIYRDWSLKQSWAPKKPLAERTDFPEKWIDFGFFILADGKPDGKPERVEKIMLEAERLVNGKFPIGVHWYNWFKSPSNNTCIETAPVYDPRPGIDEIIQKLVKRNLLIMPYIDVYLWGLANKDFAKIGSKGAAKKGNGDYYLELYPEGKYAAMCPYSKEWQERIWELCDELVEKRHANALYLDELALQPPMPCFDASHGHKLGGGNYWVAGFRKILEKLRTKTVPRKIPITVESFGEAYIDCVDGFLMWCSRYQEDVPVLPAVYSGQTIFFSSRCQPSDTLESFRASMGRDFLWGSQIGWIDEWIILPEYRAHFDLLVKMTQLRLAVKEFLVKGELVDELRPLNRIADFTSVWQYRERHEVTMPSVQGTLWRSPDGELLAAVANLTDKPQFFSYDVDCAEFLPKKGEKWEVCRRTENGEVPLAFVDGKKVHREECLGAGEVRLIVIRPARRPVEELLRLANTFANSDDPKLKAAAQEFKLRQNTGADFRIFGTHLTTVHGKDVVTFDCRITGLKPARALAFEFSGKVVGTTDSDGVRRLVLPSRQDSTAWDSVLRIKVAGNVAAGEVQIPLYFETKPILEVVLGEVQKTQKETSFLLPLEVKNNDSVEQQAQVVLTLPETWQVEPGRRFGWDSIPAGACRQVLLKCTVPKNVKETDVNVQASLIVGTDTKLVNVK